MFSHKVNIFMLCFFSDPYVSSTRFELIISNLNNKELLNTTMRYVTMQVKKVSAEDRKSQYLVFLIEDMFFLIGVHAEC